MSSFYLADNTQLQQSTSNQIYISELNPLYQGEEKFLGANSSSGWLLWGIILLQILVIGSVPTLFRKRLGIGSILAVAAFLVAGLVLPQAVKTTFRPNNLLTQAAEDSIPTNIEIRTVSETEIEVSWRTDKPVIASVWYGESQDNLEYSAFPDDPFQRKTVHRTTISNLKPGVVYYFEILSGNTKYRVGGKPLVYMIQAN